MMNKKSTLGRKQLIRRYLIWCYKTTKEELDRVDRKFTQTEVDDFVYAQLTEKQQTIPIQVNDQYSKFLNDFKDYIEKKRQEGEVQKFVDPKQMIPTAQYFYLSNRLQAIEKAIIRFLGKKDLAMIRRLYEDEMTARILQEKGHR